MIDNKDSLSASSSSSSSSSVVNALVVEGHYILQAREIYAPYTNEDLYTQVAVATIDAIDASKFLKILTERISLNDYGVNITILCPLIHLYCFFSLVYSSRMLTNIS